MAYKEAVFATDSNQATHAAGQNNSSRIVTVNPTTGKGHPFITGLPTGDHPTEQLAFKGGWIYWSQGSNDNSGVVGRDNGNGTNQQDIPCENNRAEQQCLRLGRWSETSGYSKFGTAAPGCRPWGPSRARWHNGPAMVRSCAPSLMRRIREHDRAILMGYRNGYAIRFAPDDIPWRRGCSSARMARRAGVHAPPPAPGRCTCKTECQKHSPTTRLA